MAEDDIVTSYDVTLRFPPSSPSHLKEAASAIKQEFRTSVRKKRLRCLEWECVSERDAGAIFALKVGRSVEFDWTWEGAVAYRPGAIVDTWSDSQTASDADDEEMYWCGEVVEVDEAGGRVFVLIANPDQQPTTGTFFVQPFEFLALLNEVYNHSTFSLVRQRLLPRLGATEGGMQPKVEGQVSQGLPALQPMWDHAWGILWGPPGTGKTYSVGQQGREHPGRSLRAHPGRLDDQQGRGRGRDPDRQGVPVEARSFAHRRSHPQGRERCEP
jgi:hypothetical protein